MICTIYSHQLAYELVVDEVKRRFASGKVDLMDQDGLKIISISVKDGFFSKRRNYRISYRERQQPSFELGQSNDPLVQNLQGMHRYISTMESSNEHVKELLMQKVRTLNSEFSFFAEPKAENDIIMLIKDLAASLDGIVFAQPSTAISDVDTQHFLDKNLNLLLDRNGNCAVDDLEVKIDAQYIDKQSAPASSEQLARKKSSEELIRSHHVAINEHLPPLDADAVIRSPRAIAERLVALTVTNLVAFNSIPAQKALDLLQHYQLSHLLTPRELEFLNDPTEERKSQETWKCECIWTLMWALGTVEDLEFPDHLCDLNKIPAEHYPVVPGKDPNEFIMQAPHSRSAAEILDAADLYYRFDWACVDARLRGEDMQKLQPGVVYERHYALNWLRNYMGQEWDEVSCDT